MTQAINQPVQRPRRETLSADTPVPQKPLTQDESDEPVGRGGAIEPVAADALRNGYAEALAFNEQPVTIMLMPSRERNPPIVVDCWVNGKGAEVFVNGRWYEKGFLPINKVVTTRRKYVEVLCLSRTDSIQADHTNEEEPRNRITRHTSANHVFSVIEDRDPRGAEWLARVLNQAI